MKEEKMQSVFSRAGARMAEAVGTALAVTAEPGLQAFAKQMTGSRAPSPAPKFSLRKM
jgi:hypothetical protein